MIIFAILILLMAVAISIFAVWMYLENEKTIKEFDFIIDNCGGMWYNDYSKKVEEQIQLRKKEVNKNVRENAILCSVLW